MSDISPKTLHCSAFHDPDKRAHTGADQDNRFSRALDPDYFKLHEYSTSDLLTIAASYAKQLTYYSPENTPQGDFSQFFKKDVSSFISNLSQFKPEPYSEHFTAVFNALQQADDISDISAGGLFCGLFQLFGQLAVTVDGWYMGTVKGLPSNAAIGQAIEEPLSRIFITAFCLHCWATQQTSALSDIVPDQIRALIPNDPDWTQYRFSDIWNTDTSQPFPDFIATLPAKPAPADNPEDPELIRVKSAAFYLNDLFQTLYETVLQLTTSARNWLIQTLESWPEHDAHMGLFLSFIQLLKIIYKRGNTITQKHLDYYYKDVLGFLPKPAVPDTAYLLFELTKTADQYLLNKGTRFKAGKDSNKNEILYQLISELALNKTQVSSLRSVHISKDNAASHLIQKSHVLSALVVNSADGNLKDFEGTDHRFDIFGKPGQHAHIGFAIASPIFRLAEGGRKITFNFQTASATGFPDTLCAEHFQLYFTGEKEWITPDLTVKKETGTADNEFQITATLLASQPAVVDFDSKIHGSHLYQTNDPVCKIALVNTNSNPSVYEALKDIPLAQVVITTQVDHIRSVHIQTDSGMVDASKPFNPFGVQPVYGSSVYFGYGEMFKKKITQCSLTWDWVDLPSNFYFHYKGYSFGQTDTIQADVMLARTGQDSSLPPSHMEKRQLAIETDIDDELFHIDPQNEDMTAGILHAQDSIQAHADPLKTTFCAHLELLHDGEWDPLDQTISLFKTSGSNRYGTGPVSGLQISEDPDQILTPSFTSASTHGFLKLKLAAPAHDFFGHKQYPALYTQKVIELNAWAQNPSGTSPVLPNAPYTPAMKDVRLSYTAQTTLALNGSGSKHTFFYHSYPFGSEHQNLDANTLYLLPRFQSRDTGGMHVYNQAEFYIGLSSATPDSTVSLLFYMAQGSGDPEIPVPKVTWSWYTRQGWQPVAFEHISGDKETKSLLGTGILTFSIPGDIYSNPPIMGADGIWLKASVVKNHNAIPQMILISAQAGEVRFISDQENNPPVHAPLAPKTICSFVSKPGSVKKVAQPFSSFGGLKKENHTAFYQRVSERLRHKNRAISPWDYERMILEAFPDIFKVKCLSHTVYNYQNENDPVCIPAAEFAPGGTTLVVIPKVATTTGTDCYQPKASIKKLAWIKNFIESKCSVFVKRWLTITNPLYERIHVNAQVQFSTGKDFSEYANILKTEIKGFLAPWTQQNKMESISFGTTLHHSDLVYFMEQRPYVDFVKSVAINKYIGSSDTTGSMQTRLSPSTARSILVTDNDHTIKTVEHDL